jgi:hypothetical protein
MIFGLSLDGLCINSIGHSSTDANGAAVRRTAFWLKKNRPGGTYKGSETPSAGPGCVCGHIRSSHLGRLHLAAPESTPDQRGKRSLSRNLNLGSLPHTRVHSHGFLDSQKKEKLAELEPDLTSKKLATPSATLKNPLLCGSY